MKTWMTLALLAAPITCQAEPLDQRYGPDRQRGYRAEREFELPHGDFKNRDRANYLGVRSVTADDAPTSGHPDLQATPDIGRQR